MRNIMTAARPFCPTRQFPFARVSAGLCALLGMLVLAGWWLRVPELVRMLPGHAAMPPYTALALALFGLALGLPGRRPAATRMRMVIGGVMAVFSCVILLMSTAAAPPELDHLIAAPWLKDDTYSGHMSRTTALAILCAALATLLVDRLTSARRIALCQACLLLLAMIAIMGIAGYASEVELLYNWFYEKPVAPHTLLGLLLLSVPLWSLWHAAALAGDFFVAAAHRRIVLLGSNLFVGGILAVGLTAFVIQARDAERALRLSLENALVYQEAAVNRILREEEAQLDGLFLTRPHMVSLIEAAMRNPQDRSATLAMENALALLERVEELEISLHPPGTGAAHDTARSFQAPLGEHARLLWDDGPSLRKHIPVMAQSRVVAMATIDAALPRLRHILMRSQRLGDTVETGMCYASSAERMACIPMRFRPRVFDAPQEADGRPYPMTYGLRGHSGTILTTDYRGQRVIAAYRPLEHYPLAMVSKIDSAELYAPIRPRLQQQLLLMALLVAASLLAMRRLLAPVIGKLVESEDRFRSYVETTDDWVWAADAEGRVLYSNPRAGHGLGYAQHELEGALLTALLHPHDHEVLQQALAGGKGWKQLQLRYRCSNGGYRHFQCSAAPVRNAAGAITGYRGVNHDISALKRAEDELHRRQAFLDSVVENMPTMVFVKDAASLRYLVLNEAGERLLGRSRKEMLGKTDHDLFPPAQANAYLAGDREVLGAGGLVDVGEEVLATADGHNRIVHTRKIAVCDQHGRPAFLLGIGDDVTERRRAENIKNEFISVVSHELRTPLTSIQGALEILDIGAAGALPEKAGKFVRIASDNSMRLLQLINDMLDIDKIESGVFRLDMRELDLVAIVRAALEAHAGYAARFDARFVLGAHPPRLNVRGDADRLMQVMANLLSNAAKFSPPGSEVDISVEARHGKARVSIGNGGPGVPEEFRRTIFHKFSQADSSNTRNKQGSGLGLAIVKSLMDKMGGSVGYVSEPDVRTVFYFELPLLDEHE